MAQFHPAVWCACRLCHDSCRVCGQWGDLVTGSAGRPASAPAPRCDALSPPVSGLKSPAPWPCLCLLFIGSVSRPPPPSPSPFFRFQIQISCLLFPVPCSLSLLVSCLPSPRLSFPVSSLLSPPVSSDRSLCPISPVPVSGPLSPASCLSSLLPHVSCFPFSVPCLLSPSVFVSLVFCYLSLVSPHLLMSPVPPVSICIQCLWSPHISGVC